jgi:methylated-DNA-[protein]-cysteine S-methyltransferase
MERMLTYATIKTDWGFAAIVCSERGLCGAFLPAPTEAAARRRVQRDWPNAVFDASLAASLQQQIRDYFAGEPVAFDYPIDLGRMTPFRRAVLGACRRIPYGRTVTYGELAWAVGRPRGARAVGGAMARNPVPLVVPCHRVIAGDGSLCGFSAPSGVSLKRRMLELEAGRMQSGKPTRREGRKIRA